MYLKCRTSPSDQTSDSKEPWYYPTYTNIYNTRVKKNLWIGLERCKSERNCKFDIKLFYINIFRETKVVDSHQHGHLNKWWVRQ